MIDLSKRLVGLEVGVQFRSYLSPTPAFAPPSTAMAWSPSDTRWRLLLSLCVLLICVGCYRPAPRQDLKITPHSVQVEGRARVIASSPAPSATSEPVFTPSPSYPGSYTGAPTPNPTPVGHGGGTGIASHVVQPGETLSLIAAVYGCTVKEIVSVNDLVSADRIRAGQSLSIPVRATKMGPSLKLIPDSEMVYGPGYIDFDLDSFVADQGGYLASYAEEVEGEPLAGAGIVQLVSQRFSVGPRVLLTILEMRSGWVTDPHPAEGTLVYPLGHVRGSHEGLFQQLSWAAVRLNEGYYGWKWGDRATMHFANDTRAAIAPELNPGTAGVQNCLAELATSWEEWLEMVGPDGFLATYKEFFGNPFAYTVEPIVPPNLRQPELKLPWESGHTWYLTGGPHGGWGPGSGRAALDFVTGEEMIGCAPSSEWVTAAAPGLVLRSENGEVLVDLDADGFEQSSWVILYLHIYAEDRVGEGTYLERGQRIGHPSCEGGAAEAMHLHFARRYNGEWIPAGSEPCPMVLSGWTVHEDTMPYDGTMTRGDEERVARECWDDDLNGLISDNERP